MVNSISIYIYLNIKVVVLINELHCDFNRSTIGSFEKLPILSATFSQASYFGKVTVLSLKVTSLIPDVQNSFMGVYIRNSKEK